MARYQRGQQCGVDNCPSRLWKRVDGRNVCQYGHVNEFDVEINDEGETPMGGDGSAAGGAASGNHVRRILNVEGLTGNSRLSQRASQISEERKVHRKYGNAYTILQMRCFQIILCKNTSFVIEELALTDSARAYYKKIVKGLWIKLLQASENYDIGHLVMINYLAIVQMNLPLSLDDFINITFKRKFNIERCEYALPRNLRIEIPISKLSSFHGHLDYDYKAHMRDPFVASYIRDHLQDSTLNYYSIMIRKLIQRALPIELATLVKNYVDKHSIRFTFIDILSGSYRHPEDKLDEIINRIATAYSFTNNKLPATIIPLQERQFAHLKRRITQETAFPDLLGWTDQQIAEYAEYYESNVLPNVRNTNIATSSEYKDKNTRKIAEALYDCFPKFV